MVYNNLLCTKERYLPKLGYKILHENVRLELFWLTTLSNLDWPKTLANSNDGIEKQKEELINILDKYVAANINTVLLQTRVRAATIYPSNIEPWDKCLTGRENGNPNYDHWHLLLKNVINED